MRIFIDMDGTLAEWKPIVIKSDEEARTIVEKTLNQPGYFKDLFPHTNIVCLAKELMQQYEIYTVSCYRPDSYFLNESNVWQESTPLKDKKEWLKQYLPNLKEDHQLFVPDGINKAEFLKNFYDITLTNQDVLIDDYNKNLQEWEKAGGASVKCFNGINSPSQAYFTISTSTENTKLFNYLENLQEDYHKEDNSYER